MVLMILCIICIGDWPVDLQMVKQTVHQQLVHILQSAYSGELAAAYAYRGHWKSLKNSVERERIKQIEDEEWTHRRQVGLLLRSLGARSVRTKEIQMWTIGRTVGLLCHVGGWFLPMYFAGKLESGNVEEYEQAAKCAGELGLTEHESELRMMASVEREHEMFFMEVIAQHKLFPYMKSMFG